MNNGGKIPAIVLSSHTIGLGVTRALGKKSTPDIPNRVYCIDELKDVIHNTKYFIKKRYSLIQSNNIVLTSQ